MQPTTENTSEKGMQNKNEIPEDLDRSKVQYNTVRFQPIPGLGDVDKNEDRQPQVQKPQPATNTIGHLINVTGLMKSKVIHTYLLFDGISRGGHSNKSYAWINCTSYKFR